MILVADIFCQIQYTPFCLLSITEEIKSYSNTDLRINSGIIWIMTFKGDTWSAVILGGTTRGVASVAAHGAVGAGAGGPPLTGRLLPVALGSQTHKVKKKKKKNSQHILLRNKHDLTPNTASDRNVSMTPSQIFS